MKPYMKWLLTVCLACGLVACAMGGKPPVMVEYYALEYPPPSVTGISRIDDIIRVDRFSVAQIFNHVKMVYRQGPSHYDEYTYRRWRANPGDMVGDGILRDLRAAGIFKSVFSWRDMEPARFLLKGGVGEFYESDEKDGRRTVVAVDITLMDVSQKESTRQIVFQRHYRIEEPVSEATVEGLARGMSRAVEKLSARIIADIYASIKNH